MEMAGQIHPSVACFLCTNPPNVIEYEKEWDPELTVTLWRRPKTLVVQGINPRFPGHQSCELPRLPG